MKIKLIRRGGILPLTKSAESEVDFSEEELFALLDRIKADPSFQKLKDGNSYEIRVGDKSMYVDLNKVPKEYSALIRKLKSRLKFTQSMP